MKAFASVRVTGLLESHRAGFTAELQAQGYTDLSLANQLRVMADLSRWLERRRIPLSAIVPEVVDRFLAKRRRTHTRFFSQAAIAPLLRYLGSVAAIPAVVPVEVPRSKLLRRYERHLVEARGVLPARRDSYLALAEKFLVGGEPGVLTARDVVEFVQSPARSSRLPATLTALRSVLRFLFQAGDTRANLSYAVPSAPRWRLTSLPKGLERDQVAAVLGACDRRTTIGRRDFAALLLMVRLGLRAGEVAALTLDDVDWEVGVIVVHGKGGTLGRLPLPAEVGDALVAYLRRRRTGVLSRSVFLRSRAPYRGASSGAIVSLAAHAFRAAGIDVGGAHRLRHTAATQMLRAGTSLTEIAQVLRHRHIDTTAIYAKVDRDELRGLAQPWPKDDSPNRESLLALAQPWPGGVK